MKISKLIENTLLMVAAHLAWFFTTYYQHRMDGSYSAADIAFDVLFTVMITWFFVMIFARSKTLFSEGAFRLRGEPSKRALLIKWVAFIGIKCALDVVIWWFSLISVEWKYIGTGLLSAAYWLIAYAVFVRKDTAVWKNRRHLLTVGGLILLAVGVGVCYDLSLIRQTQELHLKYTVESPHLMQACRNLDYFSGVKTSVVDFVILCTLVMFHMTHIVHDNSEKPRNWLQVSVRCDLVLALFLFICVAKIAFDQQSVLLTRTVEPLFHRNYETEGSFDYAIEKKMVLHGFDVEHSAENAYHYVETVQLQKEGCASELFEGTGEDPDCVFTSKGDRKGEYVQFLLEERKVYLYGHYAICYYENGITPRIIRVDSLNQCENNAIVTELCKHLLEEGNLFVFEYAGEYLAKYEPEFLQPYVERYREGAFTGAESRWMEICCYRSEYIVRLAKQVG